MNNIFCLKNEAIATVFQKVSRQYFAGDLKQEQLLPFFRDDRLEIGITEYREFTQEEPHWHTEQTEYHLLLDGETTYIEIANGKHHVFNKGDFYVISPGTCFRQESSPGTSIFFIKVPSVNDKVVCSKCDIDSCTYKHSKSS